SDEQMQTRGAPEARNAALTAFGSSNPSDATASMPPVSKKLFAKVARAVKSAAVPRFARKTFGRAPLVFSNSSERSRKRSKPEASRIGDNGSKVILASAGGSATGFTSRVAT